MLCYLCHLIPLHFEVRTSNVLGYSSSSSSSVGHNTLVASDGIGLHPPQARRLTKSMNLMSGQNNLGELSES